MKTNNLSTDSHGPTAGSPGGSLARTASVAGEAGEWALGAGLGRAACPWIFPGERLADPVPPEITSATCAAERLCATATATPVRAPLG